MRNEESTYAVAHCEGFSGDLWQIVSNNGGETYNLISYLPESERNSSIYVHGQLLHANRGYHLDVRNDHSTYAIVVRPKCE